MADGVLGGMLGGEEEGPDAEAAAELRAGADAFAVAVAVDQFKHHPGVAAATQAFLEKQARLIEEQTAQLTSESAIRMSHLLGQSREGRLRRVGQRIRLAMQLGVAILFAAIGTALVIMVHDAVTSHAVVVEAFDTPPALAPQGLSGKVVASAVLDALQKLADATRSADAGLAAQNAWSSDVQIEVPETGVSIGEIDRLLHQRFGHDVHVTGDLIQQAGGLALTVRGDGLAPKTFTGGATGLDKLTTAAAEYVYGSSQPYRFAVYLNNAGRNADALAFLPAAFAQAQTDNARSRLANTWGNIFYSLNKPVQAIQKYRLAIALDGYNWLARENLVESLTLAEGEEAAWRASQIFLAAIDAAPASKRPEKRMLSAVGSAIWDLPLALEATLADAAHNGGAGLSTTIDGPPIADIYALMHDPASAERYITASDPADPTTIAETAMLQTYAAVDRNDPAAAIPALESVWKAWQANADLQTNFYDNPCYLGLVYGLAGRLPDAEALFKRLGPWNRCFAFHGDTLAHAGDIEGAKRVWLEGEHRAPDLPWVYLERGRWEINHGAPQAAAADFAAAHAGAPHFADPLKAWGDLLAQQQNWQAAVTKYDDALKYAPNWQALKRARDLAARK